MDLSNKMKFAFQMDPLSSINFKSDSTWQLIKEACKRGEVYYFTPKELFWQNGELLANIQQLAISKDDSYHLNEVKPTSLAEMDVIFIRQDPPYDMNYLTTTYLLEKLGSQVLFVNDPKAIRNFPEKISILDYPNLIPPTLITSSALDAKAFAKNYAKVVIKPLYSFAGTDVFCLKADDINFTGITDNLVNIHKTPFIVQEFIPEIKFGDKRVILVDGEPIGAFARKPSDESIKSNIAAGGTAHPTVLNERDLEICKAISPMLIKNGLFLVGIDIIDKYLIEINVTSPTGLVPIENFYKTAVVNLIFDKIENKISLKSYINNNVKLT